MAVDIVSLCFSVLGGLFMGSYPVPIKCETVLQLQLHPVIFQCFKTFWVFATGWFFLLTNHGAGFQFSWWGILSAFCWVPSGLCTIFSTPIIGVGLGSVLSTGTNAFLSFIVFWLVFGSPLVKHGSPGHEFYLAPLFLVCLLFGMAALVAIPRLQCRRAQARELPALVEEQGPCAANPATRKAEERVSLASNRQDVPDAVERMNGLNFFVGVVGAVMAGALSASQFGVASKARAVEYTNAGCSDDPKNCPPELLEQFNNFGSWMTSFGIGSLLATVFFLGLFSAWEKARRRPLPALHLRAMLLPGSVAGVCWVLGNFFQLAAVMRGGAAVMAASNQCFQLVTSGVWGLIYYKEVKGMALISLWVLAAVWTVTAAVLLSREKA